MILDHSDLTRLDVRSADERVLAALNDHLNSVNAERFAADPPVPLATRLSAWRQAGPDRHWWVAWGADDQQIVASAVADVSQAEPQRHLVGFDLLIRPAYRRRGIGRQCLAAIAEVAQAEQRELLMTQTNSHIPAGARFMEQIGAQPSLASRSLQLDLATFDRAAPARWSERVHERAADFELGFWAGPYPQAELAAMAHLHEVHNDAPAVSSTIADTQITADDLRRVEEQMQARGEVRWTAYVRERSTGALAGFSEVTWSMESPASIEQGVTGVLPGYRRRGLGHWLKAALLDKLIREQPPARFVRTGNAADNTAMLRLNQDLGFQTISEDVWWELRLEQALRYLAGAATR